VPFGISAPAQTTDNPLCLKIFQNLADHVDSHAGACILEIADAEFARKFFDGLQDKDRFFTPRLGQAAQPVLKFLIGALDDETGEIDIMPGIVPAFMPALGTRFQGFIISFLVLFDQAFQADISADLDSLVVACKKA